LLNALHRSASAEIAAFAFVVDAKDRAAADFYAHHGFRATAGKPLFLYLPLATVKDCVRTILSHGTPYSSLRREIFTSAAKIQFTDLT
jgi:hypothetical protein